MVLECRTKKKEESRYKHPKNKQHGRKAIQYHPFVDGHSWETIQQLRSNDTTLKEQIILI